MTQLTLELAPAVPATGPAPTAPILERWAMAERGTPAWHVLDGPDSERGLCGRTDLVPGLAMRWVVDSGKCPVCAGKLAELRREERGR